MAQGVSLQGARSDAEISLDLSVGHFQIDSTLVDTRFPVLLSPVHDPAAVAAAAAAAAAAEGAEGAAGDGAEAEAAEGVLRLVFTWNLRWTALVYVEEVSVLLQPLQLQLEQNVAARLMRLVHGALQAVEEATASLEAMVALETGGRDGDDDDAPAAAPAAAAAAAEGGGEAAEAEEAEQAPLEIFLRELRLHPLSLTIDLQMEPMCAEPELQEFHPMRQLVGLAQQLVSQARSPPRHDLALTSP